MTTPNLLFHIHVAAVAICLTIVLMTMLVAHSVYFLGRIIINMVAKIERINAENRDRDDSDWWKS